VQPEQQAEATAAYASAHPQFAKSHHFRKLRFGLPLTVSSVGIGTYLGAPDAATDEGYAAALRAAIAGGINLVDTAIVYRQQRSERVIGRVLAETIVPREQLVVCTKAGYLPDGGHSLAPVSLAQQFEQSLANLQLDVVDVFYLHNPEEQQGQLSREEFYRRLRLAFEMLEKQVAAGRIRAYGIATWSGLRVPPDARDYLDLNRMVLLARELAGDAHHFRFVQMPYNLAMPEAYTLLNQTVEKPPYVSTLNAAFRLGLQVIASASLMNGRLARLPDEARAHLAQFLPPSASDAELALQFVRSTSSVAAALVGMSNPDHVAHALRAAATPPSPPALLARLLQS